MKTAVINFHPAGSLLALIGQPNCGKTALFNHLTGSRQKVANYSGVTVERKEGRLTTTAGKEIRVLDLPGIYSLYPRSLDEEISCDVLFGRAKGEKEPDCILCVVDSTNLRRNLRLVLAIKRLGIPCMLALNMVDVAEKRGLKISPEDFSSALGIPVVSTVAIKGEGIESIKTMLDNPELWKTRIPPTEMPAAEPDHEVVDQLLEKLRLNTVVPPVASDRIDRITLHPILGPIILAAILFIVFQSVFSLAEIPMGWIEDGVTALSGLVSTHLTEGWLKSLLVDGIITGVGGVIAFLPQILILFFFILVLEESGYLPRAAFLLDRIMISVGLSGRSFLPLLSSFACAIPGIMATRTISSPRDRLVTIMIAPLMTCSARLPVYALLIGAFIPNITLWGFIGLQGLVLFTLYVTGIMFAMCIAWVLQFISPQSRRLHPLMMELPNYHVPGVRNIAIGLWQRGMSFLKRVGGIVMLLSVVLWFVSSHPVVPEGAHQSQIEYSYAGKIGKTMSVLFEPIGFNWQISVALIPAMAAREVLVSALATVYALSDDSNENSDQNSEERLKETINKRISLATAFSLLAWFIFAPHCLATLAIVKRETGNWKMPVLMAAYLFALAYIFAWITFRTAIFLGLG